MDHSWLEIIIFSLSLFVGLLLVVAIIWYFTQFHLYIYFWGLGISDAVHRIRIDKNVVVPMSDGVNLLADVYRPKKKGTYPVILMRTPYGKTNPEHDYSLIATIFSSCGYVFIIQDVRGKYGSEGVFYPFVNEERDGRDTIEWTSKQKWSNGKAATFGFSYLGSCAWLVAPDSSPTLKTMIPMFCCQNAYSGWVDSGVPYLKDILFWLSKHHGRRGRIVTHEEVDAIILQLPVLQFDKRLRDGIETFRTWMSHLEEDSYWQGFSVSHRREQIDIPALFVGGWFDRFVNNTVEDFIATMKITTNENVKKSRLIIGPWGHQPTITFPNVNFGYSTKFRHQIKTFVHWFDIWLKDVTYDFDEKYPITYFMMGKNEWRSAQCWPPMGAREKKLYLVSRGKANTGSGDGQLGDAVQDEVMKDRYMYDPETPAPSVGNKMLYGNETDGPREQSEVLKRDDILVYQSQPMTAPYEIAGPVKVIIYVSSTALDTDFTAKLCDVRPDGKSYYIINGFVRMRYLSSVRVTHGIEKEKIYRVEIFLGHTAYTFLPGHRIQLQVSSSDFPNHGRNLNTGGSNEGDSEEVKAYQTIFHGGSYDSHLSLPELPRAGR
jgi:putative CocE/NonD family hydrolase